MQENKTDNTLSCNELGLYYFSMIALFFILSMVGQFVYGAFSTEKGTVYYVVNALCSVLSMAVVILYVLKRKKQRLNNLTCIKKTQVIYYLFAVILAVGILCGLGSVNTLFSDFIKSIGGNIVPTVIPLDHAWQYVLFAVLLALLPAVVEECFFRGLILTSLSEKASLFSSSLITALAFAVYHCSFQQLIYQFIYGFFLCCLAIKAKSVLPCILAHFLNNFIVLSDEFFGFNINFKNVFLIIFGLVLLVAFCIFIFVLKNKKEKPKKTKLSGFFLPYGIVAIAFCLMTAVLGVV